MRQALAIGRAGQGSVSGIPETRYRMLEVLFLTRTKWTPLPTKPQFAST